MNIASKKYLYYMYSLKLKVFFNAMACFEIERIKKKKEHKLFP
jgi:hypothetical protein